jgi:uncharacterized protein YyaL (SSP411 family)
MRVFFILILFSLNACSFIGKNTHDSSEATVEAELDEIISEEPLSPEEIDRYFADLSTRYKKVYLNSSRKEALSKELHRGDLLGNHERERSMVMELMFNLANSKLPYCFHIPKDLSEEQAEDITKKSLKSLKKLKAKDLDFTHMYLVNYYADAYLFLGEKSYLSLAEQLYEKLLKRLTNREGFFIFNTGESFPDMDDNAYALLTMIKLYRNTLDLRYLEKAVRLSDQILDKLEGSFVNTDLANSLLYLYSYTGEKYLLERARYFADLILNEPEAFRTSEHARFMNFLYYFLPEQSYKDFAAKTLEKIIKEQIKADEKNYYSLLLLKAELASEPAFLKLSAKNLRDTDALDLLRTFLKKPTNYYILELISDENLREPVLSSVEVD